MMGVRSCIIVELEKFRFIERSGCVNAEFGEQFPDF